MRQKKPSIDIDMSSMWNIEEVKNKILFLFFILILYRFGSFVPLPGIDPVLLKEFSSFANEGVFGMFNLISGGSLERMSILTLSIMPYITSSIIIHILTVAFPSLSHLKQEGEAGKKKLNQWTKYLTIVLCLFQSFTISAGLSNSMVQGENLVIISHKLFIMSSMSSLTTGTMLVMWFADQINAKGIGNGMSLIIFAGIVSGMPSNVVKLFSLARAGSVSIFTILFVLVLCCALLYFVVFVEKATRNVVVTYPKRQQGNKVYGGDSSYLPIKINNSGVIPPIFASSILLFPHSIAAFNKDQGGVLGAISKYLAHGTGLYITLYAVLIMLFSFFYTSVVFNPTETADSLKKYGGFVTGRRPGAQTAKFLEDILIRLTVIGSMYLMVICIFPEIIISQLGIPFYIGGTSLLIMVSVVIDVFAQIQSKLFSSKYKNMMKKYQS